MIPCSFFTFTPTQFETEFPDLHHTLHEVKPVPTQLSFAARSRDSLALLQRLPSQGLAIVGTRYPTDRSVQLLRKWIRTLRGSNLILISGLAQGIDATVHEEALAANLPTIAILGHGLDHVYPAVNRSLRDRILQAGGILVSEFEQSQSPLPWQFLLRNRLIAAWSRATLVMEAPEKSGALNTARWASDLGRMLYSVPAWPEDRKFLGNQKLLDENHAEACWGIHSLGSTWLPLSTWNNPSARKKMASFTTTSGLISFVENHSHTGDGIEPLRLIDLAVQAGWTETAAFEKLQEHLKNNELVDRRGLVLINSASSD